MASSPVSITPRNGMVDPSALLSQPNDSFRSLLNCRLVNGGGALEQTPPFFTALSHTAGSYYNGGTLTEPSNSKPALLISKPGSSNVLSPANNSLLWFAQYGAYSATTRLQVIKQTTFPAAPATVFNSCLAIINSFSGLALTLGSTLDVEMTATAAFRWRKNGGGWTAGVPSTTGVAIDSGSVTLYFLANTGFAGTETWSWTRSDWLGETSGTSDTSDWSYVAVNSDIYFCDAYGRVMMYSETAAGIQSVGYRPIFGSHVEVFENHLFVGNYSETTFTTDSNVVANSDLNNLHNFFPTDVNEADTYTIPGCALEGNARPDVSVCGFWVQQQTLYILHSTGLFRTGYDGLPTPFSIKRYKPLNILRSFSRPIVTADGIYFVTARGMTYFDGANLSVISKTLFGLGRYYTSASRGQSSLFTSLLFGGYDTLRNEVYFMLYNVGVSNYTPLGTGGFYVYQEATKTWYFRAADFTAGGPLSICCHIGVINLGYSLSILREDWNWSNGSSTFIKDFNFGASYTAPTIETQDIVLDGVQIVHEINQLYLDASYEANTGVYSTAGVQIEASGRQNSGGTVSYSVGATWTSAATDGSLSYRQSWRILRFRISAIASSSSTIARNFIFNTLVLSVLNLTKDSVRK